ncbi:hypothetical protein OG369_09850 [Streptomyces sp. NBC_01221]|uniref:hypothetical protein n=1 Tax=Streptomyces sp. NBC_01221 TaxID=2903782 RepID=UPI00225236CB|nr:hypothetical protein [Streptomyces sp. NBC_01221]MCX4786474.1 hypothetical protein [Streptomyces sp. NBC_01221]
MVADEIRAEIEQLGVASVAPGQAALAETLARTFDETDAPTSRAVVARELGAVMKTLRGLAPVQAEGDALDDLAARRARRRGA